MAEPIKIGYILDLSSPGLSSGRDPAEGADPIEIRPVMDTDADALAEILLEGYRGTIDYEGEEIEEAIEAVADFFAGAPLLEASMIATVDGAAASAVLVMTLDDGPFLSHVFSHPSYKRTGLARRVVTAACDRLGAAGETEVRFAITKGNTASERLFDGLGAVPESA